jgi:hypothetical protein
LRESGENRSPLFLYKITAVAQKKAELMANMDPSMIDSLRLNANSPLSRESPVFVSSN